MKSLTIKLILPLILCASVSTTAYALKLSSTDISPGKVMSTNHEFQGFGCNGKNLSPQLSWSGAPKGTEAFAILAYDPDAPTGSGWWHWQLVNIPKDVTSLATGVGDPSKNLLPAGSMQMTNDFGLKGFGGPCPPAGQGAHHYQFTIYALSISHQVF